MEAIKDKLNGFYKEAKEELNFYPGLNLNRLVDDFCRLYDVEPNQVWLKRYDKFLELVNKGIPLQYILNESYFFKHRFYVDSRVLIPRSETEILVEESIKIIRKNFYSGYKVAEVGVGSFCIGLSILMEINSPIEYIGGDIDQSALEVAEINLFTLKNNLYSGHKISLLKSDKMENLSGNFDLIISNPPYIKVKEGLAGVHPQTLKYEPSIALFLEDSDYEQWFDLFFKQAHNKLNSNGIFFMEGHEDCLLELKALAEKYFKQVEIIKDYTQRERFLKAYR